MATIKLFDPNTGTFATVTAGSNITQNAQSLLMLNILIELRAMNKYLANMNPDVKDDIQALRQDEIAEGPG
jgi:hypothetical protein